MTANGQPVSQRPIAPIKRRILLVDDDPAVLLTLKAVLEMSGFEIETASSSAAAFDRITSNTYHMVITDARMESETSGREVIRAAQKQPYAPATALFTAYPPANGDWHGAQTLLVKPVGTEDMLRQIEALLIRHEDEKQLRRTALHVVGGQTAIRGERRRKVS